MARGAEKWDTASVFQSGSRVEEGTYRQRQTLRPRVGGAKCCLRRERWESIAPHAVNPRGLSEEVAVELSFEWWLGWVEVQPGEEPRNTGSAMGTEEWSQDSLAVGRRAGRSQLWRVLHLLLWPSYVANH